MCPRCRSPLHVETDHYGSNRSCMMCGYSDDVVSAIVVQPEPRREDRLRNRKPGLPQALGSAALLDGCWVAPHCVDCPLAACIYEGRHDDRRRRLDTEIHAGASTTDAQDVAARFGISLRTVERAMALARKARTE